jgi:serine/threonine protein phosphatase 1
MKRQLVIGDIHGALKALEQVLERSNYNNQEDQLIFLGDYVDGWSESAQVVQALIEIEKFAKYKPIFIIGNHDFWCKEWLNTGKRNPVWEQQGGASTIASYVSSGYITSQEHKDFFNNLKLYHHDIENNKVFVHGGYTSHEGIGNEKYDADYFWDRELWSIALVGETLLRSKTVPDEYKKLPRLLRPHNEIFIGHTQTMYWDSIYPMKASNVWNIDTACGFNGVLTCIDANTKEYWHSDYSKELYPNELGRN